MCAVLVFPVRLTVLAPGELVAANPSVVRSPLDGVVERFHIKPNQSVKKEARSASPETSVLDANNECWDARGLYVTDGAALPSQGINHPTLTIMALTARACAHAMGASAAVEKRPERATAPVETEKVLVS